MKAPSNPETERRLEAAAHACADGFALLDRDRRLLYANRAFERLLGVDSVELVGSAGHMLIHADDRPMVRASFAELVDRPGDVTSLEYRVLHADGSIRWVDASFTNLLHDPEVGAVVANVRDITRLVLERQRLRDRDLFHREAESIARVGSWVIGLDPVSGAGISASWSEGCYRIFGVPESEPVTVASFYERVHPDDRSRVQRASLEARNGGAPYAIDHRVVQRGGAVRWVHERAVVERDEFGVAVRMLGTVQDITERRRIDDELRASSERYRRIVESTSDGVVVVDDDSKLSFVNGRFAEMLGYEREDMIGHSAFEFFEEAWHGLVKRKLAMRRAGVSEAYEVPFRRCDGSALWTLLRGVPLMDEGGRVEGALAVITDIHARREEQEVRNHLAAIVEGSDDAIFTIDLQGEITSWNRAAVRLFQYTAGEAIGRPLAMLIPPDVAGEEPLVLAAVLRGETIERRETRRRRKDGSIVEVLLSVSPIRNAAGAIVGASRIVRDLTEHRKTENALRRSEEQLRQALKMEAIGSLAGGVAHDFNNLLTVILSYANLIEESLPKGAEQLGDIAEIRHAGERATSLTGQLLAFSRQQILQPRVVDLNEIVAGVERLLGRLLREDIELSTKSDGNVGDVFADPSQIEQVIINIAVNARDAMPAGGKLTITTSNVTLDAAYAKEHFGVVPGPYVLLSISDTGSGMDAATQARIFEPFFTTKEKGKGTGLGLSTVFGIVQQSGGHIEVRSALDRGSTFDLYFPRLNQPEAAVNVPAPASTRGHSLARGSETILLAEDEEQVRQTVERILRRYGYTVLGAASGPDALTLCETHGEKIDLLLTDVIMPKMNGRQLAERFAALRPDAKVLFMSGYTEDAILHDGVRSAGIAFLQKPVVPDALLRKLREVLDGGDGKHA